MLSSEEFASLLEVSRGDARRDIPQLHWERLVALGYALRRLGVLGLTEAGIRRLAAGNDRTHLFCPGSSNRSPPSCGLVIAWRTNCAVAQLAMNPLQQRAPFLLRKVRKSKRSGDYSSHQSIAIFPPKNSTTLDLMPTIYLLRERSGITHLGQSLGKRADRRRRCSRQAHRVGWI